MSIIMNLMHLLVQKYRKRGCKFIDPSVYLAKNITIYNRSNIIMEEHTHLSPNAVIINTRARFIMKKGSGSAIGLIVSTGNHMRMIGKHFYEVTDKEKDVFDVKHIYDQDVIVDEDVWFGSNVTLLSGTHIGRGASIGAGCVVRGNIPPYSIVIGNPAKITGFVFTPEQIIEHEKQLFPENERLPEELLVKNYQKYFINKMKEIRSLTSTTL